MMKIRLIASRAFRALAFTKSTIISTVVMVVVVLCVGAGFRIATANDWLTSTSTIALEPQSQPFATTLRHLKDVPGAPELKVVRVDNAAAAERLVREGDTDYALVSSGPSHWELLSTDSVSPTVEMLLNQVVRADIQTAYITELGGSASELASRMSAVELSTRDVSTGGESSMDIARATPALVVMFIVVTAVISGASALAMSIVEEKTSRVIEVVLSTVKPLEMIVGKVVGAGAFALTFTAINIGAALAALWLSGFATEVPLGAGVEWLLYTTFGLVGYFGFAFLFAGVAATATRPEDTSAATAPLTLLLVAAGYIPFFGVLVFPSSPLLTVGSFIPLIGTFTAPLAYALGRLSLAVTLASLGLHVFSAGIGAWLSARIYRSQILHFGTRVSLFKALRSA